MPIYLRSIRGGAPSRLATSALLALALFPVAARADAPETLAQSSKWLANYDPDSCQLFAEFGTGDAKVVARFTRYEPGDAFDLTLYGNRLQMKAPRSDVTLDFGLKGEPATARSINGTSAGLGMMIFSLVRVDGWRRRDASDPAPLVAPEQEARVGGLTVEVRGEPAFRLTFGSLAKPLAEMRRCTTDLVKSWGYDPDEQATLSVKLKAVGDQGGWLRSSDFPDRALGRSGLVQFRLDANASGNAIGCRVLGRSDVDAFADATCRAIQKRAKLQPARNAAGKPVPSYFIGRAFWNVAQ